MSIPQKGLVIMGHGSRRETANTEFIGYAKKIAQANAADQSKQQYPFVSAAFLELSAPTLMQACEEAVAQGSTHLDIYPLFLNQGRHVERDIPMQVAEVMERFDKIEVRLLDYMGNSTELTNLVLNHLEQQQDK